MSSFFLSLPAIPEIYTLSLHDALPIWIAPGIRHQFGGGHAGPRHLGQPVDGFWREAEIGRQVHGDRKSTRLNSSHEWISYAVFCLKKKKERTRQLRIIAKTERVMKI